MPNNQLLQQQQVVKRFLSDHDIPMSIVHTIVGALPYSQFMQLHAEVVHYQRMTADAHAHVLHVDKLMQAANGEVLVDDYEFPIARQSDVRKEYRS